MSIFYFIKLDCLQVKFFPIPFITMQLDTKVTITWVGEREYIYTSSCITFDIFPLTLITGYENGKNHSVHYLHTLVQIVIELYFLLTKTFYVT